VLAQILNFNIPLCGYLIILKEASSLLYQLAGILKLQYTILKLGKEMQTNHHN
jgi:hypothetical protein